MKLEVFWKHLEPCDSAIWLHGRGTPDRAKARRRRDISLACVPVFVVLRAALRHSCAPLKLPGLGGAPGPPCVTDPPASQLRGAKVARSRGCPGAALLRPPPLKLTDLPFCLMLLLLFIVAGLPERNPASGGQ